MIKLNEIADRKSGHVEPGPVYHAIFVTTSPIFFYILQNKTAMQILHPNNICVKQPVLTMDATQKYHHRFLLLFFAIFL